MEKTFSIIMPAWNRADTIGSAIESVLEQTFNNYELLIMDDGSDDDLEQAVRPFLSKNILYHRRPRLGVGAARNFGLEQACGTHIAYLDSDNTWHPDFLTEMYKALHRSPQHHAAYCKCNRFKKDAQGQICFDTVLGEPFDFKKLVFGNYIDLNTFVHSKKALGEDIHFDESLKRLNDWDFILKITLIHTPLFIKKILADYNYGFHQNTITCNEDFFEPLIKIKERYRDFDTRTAEINHDGIIYKFENLPDKKYYNFLKTAHQSDWNTDTFSAPGFPYMLQIEPTNFCNLSCTVCPAAANKSDLNRDRRHLRLDEFKKIVDDMQDYLLLLVMWDWGEPFLNPDMPEMIRYASDKGIQTVTSTNAHFLNDTPYLERILTSGLTTLILAIDSLKKDSYNMYRRGGNLAQALAGLTTVLNLKKKLHSKTLVNLRMVLMKSNEDELESMRSTARKLRVDRFSVKTANPTCGTEFKDKAIVPTNPKYRRYQYKPGTYERIRTNGPCTMPWFMLNIHSNGTVVPCCYDFDQQMVVGNAVETPLTELWNAQPCRSLRKKLFYDKDTRPKCRLCNINFKLSNAGWIAELEDCNLNTKKQIRKALRETTKKILPGSMFAALSSGYSKVDRFALETKRILNNPFNRNSRLHSKHYPLKLPLTTTVENTWNPYPLFSGSTKILSALSCHASCLATNASPHPPHVHPEEELFLLLSGELELIVPEVRNSKKTKHLRIKPGQLLFYPAGFAHTIKTTSPDPANYLMLKWQNRMLKEYSSFPFSTFNLFDAVKTTNSPDGFRPRILFEGQTPCLKKLHCHVTTLSPQAGYAPHRDPYDVVLIVLEGEIETLGRRAGPHDVIFYAAGEPHGMRNPSSATTARYIVFELHGA